MTGTIDLTAITLESGAHASVADGVCLLEAVAWVAGERHSDHPSCVCPVLGAFGRSWNDSLDENTRQRLKAYIPRMISTSSDGRSDERAWMCLDWLTRECAPSFLDLTESLKPQADALRSLAPITNAASLALAQPVLGAAREASAAARSAAWDAARSAAWSAAWAAARDAAWDAARSAAWSAAWAAAGKTLAPVVARLQESAFDLLDRMCKPEVVAR
jgi:hypothetical protein